jgi:serine protease Do
MKSEKGEKLTMGQTVYAIGSPKGRRNEVDLGAFLGYERNKKDNEFYMLTNAPIDHGSSGSPLIDVHGKVLGVIVGLHESKKGENDDAVGCAIPIKTVFNEFRDILESSQ